MLFYLILFQKSFIFDSLRQSDYWKPVIEIIRKTESLFKDFDTKIDRYKVIESFRLNYKKEPSVSVFFDYNINNESSMERKKVDCESAKISSNVIEIQEKLSSLCADLNLLATNVDEKEKTIIKAVF